MNAINGIQAVFADINNRLAVLEQSSKRIDETFTPNSYSVDAAGNVNVSGINLPAGTNATPPTRSRIRWLRQSDGSVVADIDAYYQTGGTPVSAMTLNAYALGAAQESAETLIALDDLGNPQATIGVLQIARGASAQAAISIAGTNYRLMDQAGESDFVGSLNQSLTATAGIQTLPANPAGFFVTKDTGGTTRKVPFYNV